MQKTLLSLALSLISLCAMAQIKATTEDGREVLLMRDGTWQFAAQAQKAVSFDCASLTKSTAEGATSNDVLWVDGQSGKKIGIVFSKATDGNIAMLVNADGAGNCMQKGSAINVVYRDGSTQKLSNDMEPNCNKRGSASLGKATKDNTLINTLKNKEVATMNVYTKEGSIPVTLDAQQSKVLLNTLWCLTSTK